MNFLKQSWREVMLGLGLAFFCLRELGTFPAAWTDDSLFMIVAREWAEGQGYGIALLDNFWAYPYFLAVGPPLIGPVALVTKLFGFSVALARVPMIIYIALSTVVLYRFTKHIGSRSQALWATALLISLSAFINTGKTVMGEVPAFFFLLLGLYLLQIKPLNLKWNLVIGLLFGLSVTTKLTMGLIYLALGLAWLVAVCKKDRHQVRALTQIGLVAVVVYMPWRLLEMGQQTGLGKDFAFLFSGDEAEGGLQILHGKPEILLRPQFVYYQITLLLGAMGLWLSRRQLKTSVSLIIAALIATFTLYFLSSFGWYRHLLPAHLLLIPFVPRGLKKICPAAIGCCILTFFVLAQGYWQLTYKGSSRSQAAPQAAAYINQNLADTPLITNIAQIYVHLPRNPNWRFLTNPTLSSRLPPAQVTLTAEQKCYHFVRTWQPGDSEDWRINGGKFVVVPPCDSISVNQ